ncbi:sialate O-acetylesterase [Paenibacillus sp. TAB 01]|uniref:sialate O-acetylesterase n=1 Tax=Paenibacillus sp. TAB 01 TaxID=3368988 RepID=UPI003751FC4F
MSTKPDRMKLFLLIGQSNMAGRGELTGSEPAAAEGIWTLAQDLTWKPAADPLHFDKPDIVGVGPGLSFAEQLVQGGFPQPVGLIPCAVGGTRIERWVKGADLYEQAVQRAQAALEAGELSGILWAQGESDTGELELAQAYKERFFSLIRDVRADLGCGDRVPFLAAKLGTFLREEASPYTRFINEAVEAAQENYANYGWVDTAGLTHKGDDLHYDADSARALGRRFAERYVQMNY